MSLAKLVVHLQANYSGLTSGLQVARNQTVVAAQSITQSVDNIRSGKVTELARQADTAAVRLEVLAQTADLLEQSLVSAAFTAQGTAKAVSLVGTAANTISPSLNVASKASTTLSGSLVSAAHGAQNVGGWLARFGAITRAVAGGLSHLAHTLHAVMIVSSLLGTAFSMLMIPLRMIGSAAALIFMGLAWALHTVLLPVKLLWNGLILTAQAIWAVVRPLTSVAIAVAKVWFAFYGWIASLKLVMVWLAALPPRVRILVGALMALGIAGKLGSVAIRVLGFSLTVLATGARLAIGGVKLLALPILAIVNPAAAARMALQMMAGAAAFLGRVAFNTALAVIRLAASIASLVAAGVSRAAASFVSLSGAMLGAAKTIAVYGAIAATIFGVKLATAAETSRVVFGTMLHDMEQGKALLDQMQASKIAPFFDAKAIQDAGRDLLKAGVPVNQITSQMEKLGTMAIATKSEIGDLSRVMLQGMGPKGFRFELLDQLNNNGIPIFKALTAVTGKSGDALTKMIQDGKIGAAEMNAAIDHMTLGHGIYAGVVDNVAKTTAGLWAQSTNNIGMALQTMFSGAVDGQKGLLSSFVELTAGIKEQAATIAPVILQMTETIKAALVSVYDVGATVWTSLFGVAQTNFSSMLNATMDWVTKFRWFFSNLVPIVQFVGLSVLGILLGVFNDLTYWITTKIPAYLTWFGDNWQAVFRDLADGTMTVFINLGKNIKNAMGVIWEFIKSGGTSGLEFTWTPLLDGFRATVAELPEIPERAMTALEQSMQEQVQTIGTGLADSFDAMTAEAQASMAAAAVIPPIVPLQSTPAGGEAAPKDPEESPQKKAREVENKAVKVQSEEGQKALASLLRSGMKDDKKAAEKIAADSRDHLARIARNTETAPKLRSRQFAPG